MLSDVLKTERLTLRPWAFEDVTEVLGYAEDEEWGRYLPLPRPYTEADARSFIAMQVLQSRQEHPSWAAVFEGRVIGGVDLRFLAERRIAEVGYSIARRFWNRSLATEAAGAVVKKAFEVVPELTRVRAMADARNVGSIRVLKKLGFRCEGTLRANRFVRGEAVDEAWCGVLRSEWRG